MALVRRPDDEAIFRNHEDRLRALERGSGIGLRFDVDNEGGWLYVVTNDCTDIDFGPNGIVLVDAAGCGIFIQSDGGEIVLQSIGEVQINGSPVLINGNPVGTVQEVTSGDGSIDVSGASGPITDLAVAVVDGGSP